MPVKYIIPITTNDYQTATAAACTYMTQDNHVDIVLSALGLYFANLVTCLGKAHVVQVETGPASTDAAQFRAVPSYFVTSQPDVGGRFAAVLNGAHDAGLLTKGTQLGVVLEDCSYNRQGYEQAIAPTAKSFGVGLDTYSTACANGFADAGSQAAALQSALLRFQSDGVTRVLFASTGESVMHLLFDKAAEQQGYSPTYLASSQMEAASATEGNFNPQRLSLINGWGSSPDQDVDHPQTVPAAKRCDGLAQQAGLGPSTQKDHYYVHIVCDGLDVLAAASKSCRAPSGANLPR